ncbi:MAG TPA: ABC transporter permease [Acidimicrobiia bacterium]|nr:ABC transporter permease [Acidimicrobiia bacterium]
MKDLLPFLVIGITNGSVYALAGMGLALTYKTTGVFNFAHGAQAALAAYLMYSFWVTLGWPWPVAALAATVLAGVVGGIALERLGSALATESTAARVVATVGLLVAIQGVLAARYGAATIQIDHFLPGRILRIAGVNVRYSQLIIISLTLLGAAALSALFRWSRLGAAMQAVVDNPTLLGLDGTSPGAVRRWAWTIGGCFAAVSGILLAPTLGLDTVTLTLLVVQAFGAAAIGAFSSLPLTYVGGLAVGVGAALCQRYLATNQTFAQLPSVFPFLVLFVVLLVTPPRRLVERSAAIVRRPPPRLGVRRGPMTVTALATTVGLLALPDLVGSKLAVYTTALAFAVLFGSLALLVQTSGQVSLCHMSFAAVGASAFAAATRADVPWLLAVVVGGLVAVPLGAVVAIPAIRLHGVFLAVATFGFGILVERIFFSTSVMFGKALSVNAARPSLPGLHLDSDTGYYYVVLAVCAACFGLILAVRRSRLGRLLQALSQSPTALEAHGTDTNLTRLFVFCISAFLAGIGGVLIGPVTGFTTAVSFNFTISLVMLAVLWLAGSRPLLSPVAAAALYLVAPSYSNSATVSAYTPVAFGVLAILVAVRFGGRLVDATARPSRMAERGGRSPVDARRISAQPAEVPA